ncbi:MAG: insulinase family protein [Clostridia bacterium]|nr:insulinase family protein [Clostridia bacterium]
MDVQTKILTEGITLYMLPDEKFKNCVQGIYFSMPLRRETATGLALLPKLLTASNSRFTNRSALHMQAEALYGTRLNATTGKLGEMQTISFIADSIADCYAGEPLFSEVQSLLKTVICEPRGTDAFEEDVFRREKDALREDIKSVVNDKRRYALVRCIEEMCAEEPYGIRADGTEADLERITPSSSFALYKEMLATARVDIFVSGAFDVQQAERGAEELASVLGPRTAPKVEATRFMPSEVRYVQDRETVEQGKLVIGYRADVDIEKEYAALQVFNAIFGGGTSSKLFNNVREKMSLCYYASSQTDRPKGLVFVQSGIQFDKYQTALNAICAQHEEIKNGNVSEAEFSGAVQGIVNSLRSYKDSPATLQAYYVRQLAVGGNMNIEKDIEQILAVKPEQIPPVARLVLMDTVYFLNGTGGNVQ